MGISVFAKHLQAWPLEACCRRVREAGFDGLDLTVRPGGYVEPGVGLARHFADAVRTIRSFGLSVPLVTTGLTRADDPAADETLHTAADLGITELKLHYWPWEPARQRFADALDAARRDLAGIAKLAEAAKIRVNLHNHSDHYVTHSAAAIRRLLDDHDPAVVGAYVDPAHFTLEGGLAGWHSGLELLADRITLVAVKDFRWIDTPGDPAAPQQRRWVPVGDGNVHWGEVLTLLRRWHYAGPLNVHGEYQGRWSWRDLDVEQVLQQCTADRAALQRLGAAGEQKTA
jgi:sugar phosphate isomerase/epimerase